MLRKIVAHGRIWMLVCSLALLAAACGGAETDATDSDAAPATEDAAADAGAGDGTEAAAAGGEGCADGDVRLVVPYEPGGGFDTYARGVAPYLEEELGRTVAVENVPGAGGLIGANEVFNAEPDGTTIGLVNYPGAVFASLTNTEGADFDNSQWEVLGRIAAVNPVIYTGSGSPYDSAESMISAEEPVVFGLGGVGSDAYFGTIVVAEALGIPYELVTGYAGSGEADAAMIAGEVDASFNSLDSALPLIESGDAVPVAYVGTERSEELPDVPTVVELADGVAAETLRALAAIYDLERIFVTTPGTPAGCVEELSAALFAAMENTDFQADMEEAGRSLNILSGEEAQELVSQVGAQLEALRPLLEGAGTAAE
jgi:tripartite-type tricarboxylate transporter receptor subunit TctC